MALDTSPLNPSPHPIRTKDWVLVNECQCDWNFAPASMTWVTEAQMACLGKLFDWKMIRKQEGGVPAKFLKTNDSVLGPLRQRSLVKVFRHSYYRLTETGRRVYELNYYLNAHRLEEHRAQMRADLESRRQSTFGNSLTLREPTSYPRRR